MNRCIDCEAFSFKRVRPDEAREGKGHCKHRAPFIRHLAMTERDCDDFKRDTDDVINARVFWLRKAGESRV